MTNFIPKEKGNNQVSLFHCTLLKNLQYGHHQIIGRYQS